MGDFNINLLNYNTDNETSNFIDTIYSSSFFPTVLSPTRITTTSKTLIDNIFYNSINEKMISGNITTSISDHLTQYLIVSSTQKQNLTSKKQIEINSFKNYKKEDFLADLTDIYWKGNLLIDQNNPHQSFRLFFDKVNCVFNKHCPRKIITIKEKDIDQPWITKGIKNSIKIRDRIHKQFLRCKRPVRKEELHIRFKTYRCHIVNLSRICKEKYYHEFFKANRIDSKKVWDGIRSLINTKKQKYHKQISLDIDNVTVTDELIIANHFNTFFTSIAQKLLRLIPPTQKTFQTYLKNRNQNSFFLTPTTTEEIGDIIGNLKNNKAIGPHSIPTKILKDNKKELAQPLTELINLSFKLGILYFEIQFFNFC